jgi:uncharacterized membrane protein YkoI
VESLITENEALKIAQARVSDSQVKWVASFKEDEEIEYNNVTQKYKVWIVEGTFPAGNKDIYRIDASNGKILVNTEIEAPSGQ